FRSFVRSKYSSLLLFAPLFASPQRQIQRSAPSRQKRRFFPLSLAEPSISVSALPIPTAKASYCSNRYERKPPCEMPYRRAPTLRIRSRANCNPSLNRHILPECTLHSHSVSPSAL